MKVYLDVKCISTKKSDSAYNFSKNRKFEILWKSFWWESRFSVHTYGWTDVTRLVVTSRNFFVNDLKKSLLTGTHLAFLLLKLTWYASQTHVKVAIYVK